MEIALMQMKQARKLADETEKLERELSSNMIDAINGITNGLDDIAETLSNGS